MAKGAGGAGGKGSVIRSFLRNGLSGADVTHGLPMRAASFEHLRAGGSASSALPVTVSLYPGQTPRVTDGRHRISVARERGSRSIQATVIEYGPRGGVRSRYTGPVKI